MPASNAGVKKILIGCQNIFKECDMMKCPQCGAEMEQMWFDEPSKEAVCHCWNCDFDALWKIEVLPSGEIKETYLRQYFFG